MPDKKKKAFDELSKRAAKCTRCEAMCGRSAVLGPLNGSLRPRVMFIAEAPGRQGADRTRKPFYGDKSGEHFERMLESISLRRSEVFITNSVLCSPRSESGANRKPTKREIGNCKSFLTETVNLIDPAVIVTLGTVALEAIKAVEPHSIKLAESVAKRHRWNGRTLIPLYHPSPQVLAATRSAAMQLRDFKSIGRALSALQKKK